MKKVIIQKQLTTVILLTFFSICFFSCSSEDDENQNDGSHNTTEVAVTSDVSKLGITYAHLDGYVNLNLITSSYTSQKVGIELSTTEDFENAKRAESKKLEGRKLTIVIDTLSGQTKYYYRTYVKINDLTYYGEKRTFTTKDFTNVTSTGDASDITFTSVKINCQGDKSSLDKDNKYGIGVVYSVYKNFIHQDSIRSNKTQYIACHIDSIKNKEYDVSIYNLQPGRTYYYSSFTRAGKTFKLGEIKSFTTQSLSASQLETGEATDITLTSATIKSSSSIAKMYPEGTAITYGIRYSPKKESLENNEDYQTANAIIENQTLTAKLNRLFPDSTYFYQAFARVGNIVLSGAIKSFKTKSGRFYLSTDDATDVTHSSATLNGQTTLETLYSTNTNIRYYIRYSKNSNGLNATNNYDYYTTISPNKEDNKLYASLQNLNENTTYYFCVVAYIEGYYICGDVKSFTTEEELNIPPSGNGTLKNPFNSVAANNYVASLPADAESDKDIYIKGKVASVKEQFSTQYGNATFYISDDGTSKGQFYVFRTLYLGNKKYTDGENIKVGDEVIICGRVTNYMGNTPETVTNKSYIYSLNGKTADGESGGTDEPENPGSGDDADGKSITLVPSEMGYENAAEMTTITLSDGTTLTFDAGGNQNGPKYYNTGKGIRMYPKNTMMVSSTKKITSIVMTCDVYNGVTYNASGDLQANPGTTSVAGNTVTFGGINSQGCTITNTSTTTGAPSQVRMTQLKIVYAE